MTFAALVELRKACELFERAQTHGGRSTKFLPIIQRLLDKANKAYMSATRGASIQQPSEKEDEFLVFSGKTTLKKLRRMTPERGVSHTPSSSSSDSSGANMSSVNQAFQSAHPFLRSELQGFENQIIAQIQGARQYPELRDHVDARRYLLVGPSVDERHWVDYRKDIIPDSGHRFHLPAYQAASHFHTQPPHFQHQVAPQQPHYGFASQSHVIARPSAHSSGDYGQQFSTTHPFSMDYGESTYSSSRVPDEAKLYIQQKTSGDWVPNPATVYSHEQACAEDGQLQETWHHYMTNDVSSNFHPRAWGLRILMSAPVFSFSCLIANKKGFGCRIPQS